METTQRNNINNSIETQTEPKKRGRPRKTIDTTTTKEESNTPKKLGRPLALWRHREDGSYDSHAIDPEYAKKYWRTELIIKNLIFVAFVELL